MIGGVKLLTSNGMGIPVSLLHGWFDSYHVPAIMLMLIGTLNIYAAFTLFTKSKIIHELSVSAGFSIMIFEFAQLYIINKSMWLQIFYFGLGMVIVLLSILLNRYETHK